MCGLAGMCALEKGAKIRKSLLLNMLRQIEHRGPDEAGVYLGARAGLGSRRLSMVDLSRGSQPMSSEDHQVWMVFTGEIYNHNELREELIREGHRFRTQSDTEVLLRLYEVNGLDSIGRLNGQFAVALWDNRYERLILVRDRPGIRPLYYTRHRGKLLFASEIKSIFADPQISRRLSLKGLDQIVTFWTTVGSATAFENISELPPGHLLIAERGAIHVKRYWDVDFSQDKELTSKGDVIESLRQRLFQSVSLRSRADVPVGMYLSGGVDSSVIAVALNQLKSDPAGVKTFSVHFNDKDHDESGFQRIVLDRYGFKNYSVQCGSKEIGAVFPKVVWHAESPLFRTAPAPLYLLSQTAHREGIKAVLSGEGADEIFWGYDTFREHKVRLFWNKYPESEFRPKLLKRLFPYYSHFGESYFHMIKKFYQRGLKHPDTPFYSHLPRWQNNMALKGYYSDETKSVLSAYDPLEELASLLPPAFSAWRPLERNQYLETSTLLKGYLLSSQGDRMAMAHSVEGRYPFLDHHLMAFGARISPRLKVFGMKDKYILREAFKRDLPAEIYRRSKFAYRAPDAKSFFGKDAPDYVEDLLSERGIRHSNYFNPEAVGRLVKKMKLISSQTVNYRDNMASVIVISTLLLHDLFIDHYSMSPSPISLSVDVDQRREACV